RSRPDTPIAAPHEVAGDEMSLEMNSLPRLERAVRDGQMAAVTCAACGCRLEPSGAAGDAPRGHLRRVCGRDRRSAPADAAPWFHFGRMGGRDARGDSPACVESPHDRRGLPLLAA